MFVNDIFKKKQLDEAGPFRSTEPKKPRKGSVADLAAQKRKEQERGKQPIEPRDQRVGVARVKKDVAEGISVVDQDYDLDQMHLTLDIEGKKVYFTYWNYEEDFSNAERKDVFDQLQEQPWYKGLDHPTKMEILNAAYRAIRGLEPQEYRPTVGDEPLDEQGVAEGSIYKKDQDLSSIPTQELEAFVRKHWGGGVPTYGQGTSVQRAMRELRRRQKQGVAEGFDDLDRFMKDKYGPQPRGGSGIKTGTYGKPGRRRGRPMGPSGGEGSGIPQAVDFDRPHSERSAGRKLPRFSDDYDALKRSEIDEDWKKVNRQDRTPGMSRKAVKAYRRENPGSKLQTAVTTKPSKLKKGSKSAKRRKSFCARMKGMKRAHAGAKTKRDPNSPINKALRRWNCESIEEMRDLVMIAEQRILAMREGGFDIPEIPRAPQPRPEPKNKTVEDKKLSDQEKQSLRQTVKDIDYTKPPTDTKARLSPEEKKELRQTVKDYEYPKPTNEASAREKLDRRFQELRKKRGAPDPEYYKELGKSYDIENDQERYARQAEIKKKYQVKEARKAEANFDVEDLKRLEQIRDLPTLKAQAMALISKPSERPMKPEKVAWFDAALDRMDSRMAIIKLMYDLLLSGEGHQVIGSKRSMNPNSYRSRFGESNDGSVKYEITLADGKKDYQTTKPAKAGEKAPVDSRGAAEFYRALHPMRKVKSVKVIDKPQEEKSKITNEDVERYVEELERAGYEIVNERRMTCPECGGAAYADKMLAEKQDACYHKVKSRYKVWPSAYASGALVRCRKKGAKNWGNKSKK